MKMKVRPEIQWLHQILHLSEQALPVSYGTASCQDGHCSETDASMMLCSQEEHRVSGTRRDPNLP